MKDTWLEFMHISSFNKLSLSEIFNAFKMAIECRLKDSKGNDFNLLPELNINTTAKVLDAYLKLKGSQEVILSRQKLNNFLNTRSEEEIQEERNIQAESYRRLIFDELKEKGISYRITPEKQKVFVKRAGLSLDESNNLYEKELQIYKQRILDARKLGVKDVFLSFIEHKEELEKIKRKEKIPYVQECCRIKVSCIYLKNFISDFEEFKKEFDRI